MGPKRAGRTTGCISASYGNDNFTSVDRSAKWKKRHVEMHCKCAIICSKLFHHMHSAVNVSRV